MTDKEAVLALEPHACVERTLDGWDVREYPSGRHVIAHGSTPDRAAEKYFGEFAFLDEKAEGQRKPDRAIPTEVVSKAETWSQRVRVDSPTKRKGVSIANGKVYRSLFQAGGKRVHLGYFPLTPEGLEKASAICQLAADLHFRDSVK